MANKNGPNKKKWIRLTREVKDFILEKMHSGMDISTISRTFPDKVPVADTIYKAPLKDKEFEAEINDAYTVLLMHRLDELNELGEETWCKDRMALFDGDYKLAFEARRAKIDILKFSLGKMAPLLSKRFQRSDKLEVTGMEGNSIAVINYYAEGPSIIEAKPIERKEPLDLQ